MTLFIITKMLCALYTSQFKPFVGLINSLVKSAPLCWIAVRGTMKKVIMV